MDFPDLSYCGRDRIRTCEAVRLWFSRPAHLTALPPFRLYDLFQAGYKLGLAPS